MTFLQVFDGRFRIRMLVRILVYGVCCLWYNESSVRDDTLIYTAAQPPRGTGIGSPELWLAKRITWYEIPLHYFDSIIPYLPTYVISFIIYYPWQIIIIERSTCKDFLPPGYRPRVIVFSGIGETMRFFDTFQIPVFHLCGIPWSSHTRSSLRDALWRK